MCGVARMTISINCVIFSILSIVNSLQIGIYIYHLPGFSQLWQAQGSKQNNDIWSKAQFMKDKTRIYLYCMILGIVKLNALPFPTRIDKQKKYSSCCQLNP